MCDAEKLALELDANFRLAGNPDNIYEAAQLAGVDPEAFQTLLEEMGLAPYMCYISRLNRECFFAMCRVQFSLGVGAALRLQNKKVQ